jgi:mono/diheme cytochrome c family protein
MNRFIKWLLIIGGAVLGVLIIAIAGLSIYSTFSFKSTYADRPVYPITADTSPEGIARGKYLMEDAILCFEACHSEYGEPFAGGSETMAQGPVQVVFAPSNITPDNKTGIGAWTDAEIARAIREGIDKDGVALVIMPSYNYRALSDEDIAAVIGYLRSLEPIENEVPEMGGNLMAKILLALGMFGPDPVGEPITTRQQTPQQGTIENGKYMLSIGDCSGCHKPNLAGGPLPLAAPEDTPAANITPGGELAYWTEEDFIKAVRDGIHPGGRTLDGGMPRYKTTDQDLRDIFAYLMSLPALPINK